MDDFANAKASLTPGAAGAATMVLTATLVSAFDLPASLTALIISFLMGVAWVLMAETPIRWAQKIVLCTLNSLTIFSVAYGLNSAALETFGTHARGLETQTGFLRAWPLLH